MTLSFPGIPDFTRLTPINKGWSNDKKYYAEDAAGRAYLIRQAPLDLLESKLAEYEFIKEISRLGINMSMPLGFVKDTEQNALFALFSWCEGRDAEEAVASLPEASQEALGYDAGRALKRIHTFIPQEETDWAEKYWRKTLARLDAFFSSNIHFEGEDAAVAYLYDNKHLLKNRGQAFLHGDYHVGNMILSPEGALQIIDFNRWGIGDPYSEFDRIMWSAAKSPTFAAGQIKGYFDDNVPPDFFPLMLYYIASNVLGSIPWAIPFGSEEIEVMVNQAKDMLQWHDNMNSAVPTWY